MIDNFALGLTHALMLIAGFLLLRRPDLDHESRRASKDAPKAKPKDERVA
ncbi:hypothetical protein [Sphingomonas sp.]|nr:hypothetical protein [Sphingomonas sp.]MBX9796915.1 hypothetical protein [Sphingomonas sp.]